MKLRIVSAVLLLSLFAACDKTEPRSATGTGSGGSGVDTTIECAKEMIVQEPVNVGETAMRLPVGTKICIREDELEARVELPPGYSFVTSEQTESARLLPVIYGTYVCYCSQSGSTCKVFYADGLGFGCLQNNCTGSCTGKFTYKGYTVERIVSTENKESFFSRPEIQREVAKQFAERFGNIAAADHAALAGDRTQLSDYAYAAADFYGVSYFVLVPRKHMREDDGLRLLDPLKASCDCEGTKACTLKTVTLPSFRDSDSRLNIYFCEGTCGGCELTVE